MRMHVPYLLALSVGLAAASETAAAELPSSEFRARRAEAMRRMPDGILLLPSVTFRFRGDQQFLHGYQQGPDFFYLTGLASASGTVLAVDGAAKETWLFVPGPRPGILGGTLPRIEPGVKSASALGFDKVVDRKELAAFLARRQETPGLLLYTSGNAEEHGFPLDIALDDPSPQAAWSHAMAELWPTGRLKSSDPILEAMRQIKSPAEIAALRTTGATSARALKAGLASLRPGRPQREAEGDVVCACLDAGAEGPSFWPWVMAGPTSAFPAPFESLLDYRHLNRVMRAGEVARVDVGCDADHYKGDVGRTAPVSGRFDAGQRETWELLVAAYRAGLVVIRDGATARAVFAASLAEVRRRQPALVTSLGKKAAEVLLGENGLQFWGIHGVGLEPGEGAPETLAAGMVVAFEPIFSVEGQGFYLEDMVLVTKEGHEILTPGLPYSADEIERAVRPGPR